MTKGDVVSELTTQAVGGMKLLALGIFAGMLVLARPATAQKKPAAKPVAAAPGAAAPAAGAPAAGAPAAEPNVKVERGAGGKKVYRITSEIQITGKIQKPEAFYVLQKSGINYEWTELKQDFVPKILNSVAKAPF